MDVGPGAPAAAAGDNNGSDGGADKAQVRSVRIVEPTQQQMLRKAQSGMVDAWVAFARAVLEGMGAEAVAGAVAQVGARRTELQMTIAAVMRLNGADPDDPSARWRIDLKEMTLAREEPARSAQGLASPQPVS